MQPQRVVMSREGNDADHQALHDVPGVLQDVPHVGAPLQMWTEDGKLIRTSPVRRVTRSGSQLVVETANSRYRVQLAS